jgi:hypothetical protein
MPLQVGRDEFVLPRKMAIQSALRDARTLRYRIHAHGIDPPDVEQLLRGVKDALARLNT